MLYEEYGLNSQEIDYIESHIKEMSTGDPDAI